MKKHELLTLEEIYNFRLKAQRNIEKAIDNFTENTGIYISSLDCGYVDISPNPPGRIASCSIKIQL